MVRLVPVKSVAFATLSGAAAVWSPGLTNTTDFVVSNIEPDCLIVGGLGLIDRRTSVMAN